MESHWSLKSICTHMKPIYWMHKNTWWMNEITCYYFKIQSFIQFKTNISLFARIYSGSPHYIRGLESSFEYAWQKWCACGPFNVFFLQQGDLGMWLTMKVGPYYKMMFYHSFLSKSQQIWRKYMFWHFPCAFMNEQKSNFLSRCVTWLKYEILLVIWKYNNGENRNCWHLTDKTWIWVISTRKSQLAKRYYKGKPSGLGFPKTCMTEDASAGGASQNFLTREEKYIKNKC